MDMIDLYRTFCPNAAEYTFYSSGNEIFQRIDHKLGPKNLNKFNKIEIISNIFLIKVVLK